MEIKRDIHLKAPSWRTILDIALSYDIISDEPKQ